VPDGTNEQGQKAHGCKGCKALVDGSRLMQYQKMGNVRNVINRDYEYVRHGTMTLMAGMDLLTGEVTGNVVNRHRSKEFVDFLKQLDQKYAPDLRIQIILDNHSAHIFKETRTYLETKPGRYEFVFIPKHGSWLNVIESFVDCFRNYATFRPSVHGSAAPAVSCKR
jgi:hypothetical protein